MIDLGDNVTHAPAVSRDGEPDKVDEVLLIPVARRKQAELNFHRFKET